MYIYLCHISFLCCVFIFSVSHDKIKRVSFTILHYKHHLLFRTLRFLLFIFVLLVKWEVPRNGIMFAAFNLLRLTDKEAINAMEILWFCDSVVYRPIRYVLLEKFSFCILSLLCVYDHLFIRSHSFVFIYYIRRFPLWIALEAYKTNLRLSLAILLWFICLFSRLLSCFQSLMRPYRRFITARVACIQYETYLKFHKEVCQRAKRSR